MTNRGISQARIAAVAIVLFACSQLTMWKFQTDHTDEQSRRICGVLQVLLPKPTDPKPTTARSRLIVERTARAYRDLGCRDE